MSTASNSTQNVSAGTEIAFGFERHEVASLLDLSARLGGNPMLVQGSNGNTSIKIDDTLWIKASGTWLEHALRDRNFVSVNLPQFQKALRASSSYSTPETVNARSKPSIETAMHAVLPHRVVAHVHSVNTIAWAVRRDGPERLAERLAGLNWSWIPYVASGVPLAISIERALADAPHSNVFVLANHGLVLGGEDCASVESLLCEIERRLDIPARISPDPEAALSTVIARSTEWSLPIFRGMHALATDSISRNILRGGILYPCMAMFLGNQIRMLPHSVPLSRFAEYANGRDGQRTFVIVEDVGVILHKEISPEQRATLVALSKITQRIDEFAPLRYLSETELGNLMKYDQHTPPAAAQPGKASSAAPKCATSSTIKNMV